MPLPQLRRVRWAVRATLALGVAASVVANVLHAEDNPISQAIAAWPPLALLLTVELISRVPVHGRWLAVARLAATATIAIIAAWVSYWHMAGVAARYGETGASPYLLPLSVDGLIVVASICLVELGARIAATQPPAQTVDPAVAASTAPPASPAADPAPSHTPADPAPPASPAHPAQSPAPADPARPASRATARNGTVARNGKPASNMQPASNGKSARNAKSASKASNVQPAGGANGAADPAGNTRTAADIRAAANTGTPAETRTGGNATSPVPRPRTAAATATARPRRPVAETVALAAKLEADRPELTDADLAQELGISTARLRAVRRAARTQELVLAA